jgi:aminopeptidase N
MHTLTMVTVALAATGLVSAQSGRGNGRPGPTSATPAPGVAEALASERASRIANLRYELSFDIPADPTATIAGHEIVRFDLKGHASPLVLDFDPVETRGSSRGETAPLQVRANGADVAWRSVNGHIVIQAPALREGTNQLEITFRAGDASLNRNPDFLYTLFVPARAHLAFPCFDQPSLKGRYALTLTIPSAWQVVANGAEIGREPHGDRVTVRFAETKPLPTYLFAFAAGRFSVEAAERDGRTFRMFHRETDTAKVARNRDAIFDLHAKALAWLEDYTGIPYPWGKFDFVLIPSFQFGGMEHAGAILYNASGLMLEESATINQQLSRASTIAHETSHMWFGDLVTMQWFNDVWMKEVFANFMAAKIVNPSFPQINHELRFLLAHYPAAYEVDRTAGANAIRQRLANLSEAGTLYGAIIYEKAPIVMRNLETLVGVDPFRDGLREYLHRYSFGNATWPDLISILDRKSDQHLVSWSHAWVDQPGRPTIRTEIAIANGRIASLAFAQTDPRRRGLVWNQRMAVTLGYATGNRTLPVRLAAARIRVADARGLPAPRYVLANGNGIAYGQIELDEGSRAYLLAQLPEIDDPLTRGSAWMALQDELLRGAVPPAAFLELALKALPLESDELNAQQVLEYGRDAYWHLLTPDARLTLAPRLETALREGIARAGSSSLKSAYFRTFRDTALTPDGVAWLERVWRRQETIPGLTFAEVDDISMALEIAVRQVADWRAVLDEQLERTENPDRKARFAFVMPALDADPEVRARFFGRLRDVKNRAHEPWVLEALIYVHHPLRAPASERFVGPSLEMLREIQRTGDIFFPKRWMDATLSGHTSPATARTVRAFLASLPPSYPPRLRMTIESSADQLFRANRILNQGPTGSHQSRARPLTAK